VHCHPVEGSFSSALRDAAERELRAAGHDVTVLDLSAESFRCVMTRTEWETYMTGGEEVPGDIIRHVDAVRSAEMLIFTYPTWWSGLPAQLKGWLERVMLPGVAFTMENDRIRPALTHLRRIIVISTYGSPWLYVKAVNDNGRRTLTRALRAATGWRAKCRHIGLYAMDTSTDEQRRRFIARVERTVTR
ncbi:MAG: NAD(P)H-dependent oxidoreductase, partial [Actinomycetota bacterium]